MGDNFDPDELNDLLLPSNQSGGDDESMPSLEMNPALFILKSTALYGDSGTGKSTIIYHMFNMLRRYIPIFIVISPTAASNGDYDDRVPSILIFKEPTKELFRAIYNRQEAAAAFYRRANQLDVLERLYMKIRNPRTDNLIRTILTKKRIAVQKARQQIRGDKAKIEAELNSIGETHDETLRNIYRIEIRKSKEFLKKQKLDAAQKYCLRYLDFNPNLGLVVDDCAAQIKQWGKDETIGKIFFQGRHNFMTSIYTFQHDKLLDTTFRQNVFVSIFTSDKSARAYFGRSTNNFDKEEVKKAMAIIQKIFHKSGPKKHQKLVYMREAKQPYMKYTATIYPKFKVCFPYVQRYCEIVKSSEDIVDEDNPFMKNFLIPDGV
jgi:energy-coupling factor transporter ATP-binding protein EcfA2